MVFLVRYICIGSRFRLSMFYPETWLVFYYVCSYRLQGINAKNKWTIGEYYKREEPEKEVLKEKISNLHRLIHSFDLDRILFVSVDD